MGFIQLLFVEGLLLLSAGMIFFGGIRGTVGAIVIMSGINLYVHDLNQFWGWEIPLLVGGVVGMLLLLIVGRIANRGKIVSGLVGGVISLVFFGAFFTPIVAIIVWALVVGMGIIPRYKRSEVLWGFAPTISRLILGLGWIIYGNVLTR